METDKLDLKELGEKFLDTVSELYDIPGVVIGVSQGESEFTGARGYSNYITKAPLKAEDVFHCGSVSKVFTSMGIMKLVEEGIVDLKDRLVDLLPFLSIADRRCENVRLYHMLSHTSGLADVEDYGWSKPRTDERALKDYALSDEVNNSPMLWDAGENGFRYSNMAYELLGLIIAEKSGMTYEEFVKINFLEPLGMKDSTFLTFERTGGSLALDAIDGTNMAMPHKKAEDRTIILEKDYPYNREHGPSSTLTSNAADLLKWAKANMHKKVLGRETYDAIWSEYAIVPNNGEQMGLGWFMREQAGYMLLGHEGTDDGFRASFWFCPQLDLATVVLSNISKAPVKRINKKIFDEINRSLYNPESLRNPQSRFG